MAVVSNLYVDQYTDFTADVVVYEEDGVPLNLTGYTATGQVRKSYHSSTSTPFTITFPTPRTSGRIIFSLSASQTGSLSEGRYVYDIVILSPSPSLVKTRVVEGVVTINAGVTR